MGLHWTKAITHWTRHPKVLALAALVPVCQTKVGEDGLDNHLSKVLAAGYVSVLRDVTASCFPDGDVTNAAAFFAGAACCSESHARDVMDAMSKVGLIDETSEGRLFIHGWEDMYGEALEDIKANKRKERERKSRWRAKRRVDTRGVPRDNGGTETGRPAGHTRDCPGTETVCPTPSDADTDEDLTPPTPSSGVPRDRSENGELRSPASAQEESPKTKTPKTYDHPDLQEAFAAWQASTGYTRRTLTKLRRRKLVALLKRFGLDGCRTVFANLAKSDHHRGAYDDVTSKPLCDPDLCEAWLEGVVGGGRRDSHPRDPPLPGPLISIDVKDHDPYAELYVR